MLVSAGMMKMVTPCFRPSSGSQGEDASSRRGGRVDRLLWYKDLGRHANGEFSMAVVQANTLLEDQCQIESGPLGSGLGPHGTFVGVYDGHGGPEAGRYVNEHLFQHLQKFLSEQKGMSTDVIRKAFSATEEAFLSLVRKQWLSKPQIAAVGSCCLVGIICGGLLYVANVGDSRAVLGTSEKGIRDVTAIQMSAEHNAGIDSVREELHALHPEDSHIVLLKHNVWRVKGLIQVSRSIGDAYLKNAEFNREPLLAKFRLPEPFHKPILSAEPSIVTHKLSPRDQFLIFASDGLWEHLTNQEAAEIVYNFPHNGIARRLVKAALRQAAKKREMRYSDLKKIDRGVRRHFHDDITVVVLFLDTHLISKSTSRSTTLSLRGGIPIPNF
uniref:protein-serine/threonine phosphatase n=1 Tax=Anthurium amnicola TaxID=1678845 RepID=A0A1D1Y6H5_9ARAE